MNLRLTIDDLKSWRPSIVNRKSPHALTLRPHLRIEEQPFQDLWSPAADEHQSSIGAGFGNEFKAHADSDADS
jgi:hypothetical protein